MDRPALMSIVIVFLFLLLALMLVGWRNRQRRQSALGRPGAVPPEVGVELMTASIFYVATTFAADPLNRVAVSGLGFRSRARVTLTEMGMVLAIPGQEPMFVPASDLRGVERATWTIDRVVERDGMILVRWMLRSELGDNTEVDSYLRFSEPDQSETFFSLFVDNYVHHSTERGRAQ